MLLCTSAELVCFVMVPCCVGGLYGSAGSGVWGIGVRARYVICHEQVRWSFGPQLPIAG